MDRTARWVRRQDGVYALFVAGIDVVTLTAGERGWTATWDGGDYIGCYGSLAEGKREVRRVFDDASALYS